VAAGSGGEANLEVARNSYLIKGLPNLDAHCTQRAHEKIHIHPTRVIRWMDAMSTFYIPYCESQSAEWRVVESGKTLLFHSRREALVFAIDRCREARASGDPSAVISIEGNDGQWRSFDSRLLPATDETVVRNNGVPH
jgi:hypothetical protein